MRCLVLIASTSYSACRHVDKKAVAAEKAATPVPTPAAPKGESMRS